MIEHIIRDGHDQTNILYVNWSSEFKVIFKKRKGDLVDEEKQIFFNVESHPHHPRGSKQSSLKK